MHCTMEDLLALRDGEGSVWARHHLADCAPCRAELDRLYQRVAGLRALPPLRSPRDRWEVVRDAVGAERARHRWRWSGLGLAMAAALAGLLVARPLFQGKAYADDLAQAKRQSADLEQALRTYDPDGRVMSGQVAELAARLEDLIASLDSRLAQTGSGSVRGSQLVDLWRERVDLMQRLVQVRVTRISYVGL